MDTYIKNQPKINTYKKINHSKYLIINKNNKIKIQVTFNKMLNNKATITNNTPNINKTIPY